MLLVCLIFFAESSLNLPGTRIDIGDFFNPLHKMQVARADNGDLYILDTDEKRILHLDANGQRKGTIGRGGQGPGEFVFPSTLQIMDGLIHVDDFRSGIHQFKLDGEHVRSLKGNGRFFKIKDGWARLVNPFEDDVPATLTILDNELKEVAVLMEMETSEQPFNIMVNAGVVEVDINPAPRELHWTVTDDGKTLYSYDPKPGTITVFDVAERKALAVIKPPGGEIPFNRDWADSEVAKSLDTVILNGTAVRPKISKRYPQHFPAIAEMVAGPNGWLWVADPRYFMNPERAPTYVFNRNGKPVESNYTYPQVKRLIHLDDKQALLLCFDGEEEIAFIQRCKPDQIAAVVTTIGNKADRDEQLQIFTD